MIEINSIENSMNINCIQRHFINVNDSKNHQIIGPFYAHTLGPFVVTISKIFEFARDAIKGYGEVFLALPVGFSITLINLQNRKIKRENRLNNPLSITHGCCLVGKAFVDLLKIPQFFFIHLAKPGLLVVAEKLVLEMNELEKLKKDNQKLLEDKANLNTTITNFNNRLQNTDEIVKNQIENQESLPKEEDSRSSLKIMTLKNKLAASKLAENLEKNSNEQLKIINEQKDRQIELLNAKIKELEENPNRHATQVEPLEALKRPQAQKIIYKPPPPPPTLPEQKKVKKNSNIKVKTEQSPDLLNAIRNKPNLKSNSSQVEPKIRDEDSKITSFRDAIGKFRQGMYPKSKDKLDALIALRSAISDFEFDSNDQFEDEINTEDLLNLVKGEDESMFASTIAESEAKTEVPGYSAKKKVLLSEVKIALDKKIEHLENEEQKNKQYKGGFSEATKTKDYVGIEYA